MNKVTYNYSLIPLYILSLTQLSRIKHKRVIVSSDIVFAQTHLTATTGTL